MRNIKIGICTLATRAFDHLKAERGKATARTLEKSDITRAIVTHVKALKKTCDCSTVVTKVTGGNVAISYRYRADADVFAITTEPDGSTTVVCGRSWAKKVPFGRGGGLSCYEIRRNKRVPVTV